MTRLPIVLPFGLFIALVGMGAGCGNTPDPSEHSFAVQTDCALCHLDRFQAAAEPDHGQLGLPKTCDTCHETSTWEGAAFPMHDDFFKLDGGHAALACEDCHKDGHYTGTAAACAGCHLPDYQRTDDPNHTKAGFPVACAVCHSTAAWDPSSWQGHDKIWPLTGQHDTVACTSCHVDDVFDGTPKACAGCHMPDYQGAKSPDHVASSLPTTCESCHTTAGWKPATLDHDQFWPLVGKHETVQCASCHVDGQYEGTPEDCAGCHMPDYQGAKEPDHVASQLPTACEQCHTPSGWKPATLDHDQFWPLTGKHEAATCASCHVGGVFKGTPEDCSGCHMPDYQGAKDPDHVAAELPTACEACHTTAGWKPAELNHDQFWPLEGKHDVAPCASCHVGGVYEGTPKECSGCHMPDYQDAKDPDHAVQGYPTACQACHTPSGWKPAELDHDQFWPLEGKHEGATCSSCHVGGVFNGTPNDCWSCHADDYEKPKNPDHVAQMLPKTCQACHTPAGWKPNNFNHDAIWPITGKHKTTECTSCHVGGVYAGTETTCWGCHAPDYVGTTDPDHETEHLPTTCDVCHSTAGWKPAAFDGHDAYWPLVGKHETTACADCHVDGLYQGTSKDCKECHYVNFQETTAPNHVAEGYPPSCAYCHNPAGWKPASYDGHHDFWSLEGKHETALCTACHADGNFLGTPTQCVGCHQADYAGTKDPDHEVEAFPTTCDACHKATAWSPAEFAGHDKYWKRTGAHVNLECAKCHVGGKFKGTPKECKGCHLAKYNATTDPDHEVQGFPTTCDACHGTTKWKPASYTGHDQFWPLTGKHKVAMCGDCHKNGVFAGTSTACWGCHQAKFNATTNPDHAAAKFPHTCETCHGTAAWKPSTFDHADFWPLTGKHLNQECKACHTDGTYVGKSKACQSCHLSDWQTAASPNHAGLAISKTCDTCHGTSSWATNKFPEHDKTFIISYGDHKGKTCASCHKVSGNWSSFTCLACHTLSKMNSEHQGEVGNYQSTLNAAATIDHGCLKCHPKGLKGGD